MADDSILSEVRLDRNEGTFITMTRLEKKKQLFLFVQSFKGLIP